MERHVRGRLISRGSRMGECRLAPVVALRRLKEGWGRCRCCASWSPHCCCRRRRRRWALPVPGRLLPAALPCAAVRRAARRRERCAGTPRGAGRGRPAASADRRRHAPGMALLRPGCATPVGVLRLRVTRRTRRGSSPSAAWTLMAATVAARPRRRPAARLAPPFLPAAHLNQHSVRPAVRSELQGRDAG